MTRGRPWHKERLFFLVSSARHFAAALEAKGFKVLYLKAKSTPAGIEKAQTDFGKLPVICAEPSSHVQFAQLKKLGLKLLRLCGSKK
jgi:deoxyribodipyrimidine photolyase-related protein